MATNYVAPGDPVKMLAPTGGVVSGTAYLIGALFGVAGNTAAQGIEFPLHTVGIWNLPKATGVNWVQGAKLYWDDTAKNVTNVSSGNTLIGTSREAQINGDTFVNVRLGIVA